MLFTLSLAGALSLFLFYSYNTKSSAQDLVSYTKTTWHNFKEWLFSTDDLATEDKILNSGRTINQQHQTQTDTEATQTQEYSQKPGFLKSTQILFSNLKEIASKLQYISINTLTRWPDDNKSHDIIEDIEVDAHQPGSNTWLQKFFASISSGLDSMSREINKLIGDEIKRSNFTTALLLSGANILSSFVRFFIQKTADTKKVESWEHHADNLRKNVANKTNESEQSFDGTIATTRVDELYMNHNDYNSTLWQSAVGIAFGVFVLIVGKFVLLDPKWFFYATTLFIFFIAAGLSTYGMIEFEQIWYGDLRKRNDPFLLRPVYNIGCLHSVMGRVWTGVIDTHCLFPEYTGYDYFGRERVSNVGFIFRAMLGYRQSPTYLMCISYCTYWIVVLTIMMSRYKKGTLTSRFPGQHEAMEDSSKQSSTGVMDTKISHGTATGVPMMATSMYPAPFMAGAVGVPLSGQA